MNSALMTELGQDRVEHDAAERIVLDAENAQTPRRRRPATPSAPGLRRGGGLARVSITVSVKVVPPPRRGATTTSPPIARAIA